jgi:hypothetical protein
MLSGGSGDNKPRRHQSVSSGVFDVYLAKIRKIQRAAFLLVRAEESDVASTSFFSEFASFQKVGRQVWTVSSSTLGSQASLFTR